jgi:hypothetical protein
MGHREARILRGPRASCAHAPGYDRGRKAWGEETSRARRNLPPGARGGACCEADSRSRGSPALHRAGALGACCLGRARRAAPAGEAAEQDATAATEVTRARIRAGAWLSESHSTQAIVPNPGDSQGDGLPRCELSTRRGGQLLIGRLKDHGTANYQFRAKEDPSYYVKLLTSRGERILWFSRRRRHSG